MIQQGVYRHYKGGLYTVLMAAWCSDNGPNEGENVVIYVSHKTGSVCTRLANEFFDHVMVQGDKVVERFKFIASSLGGSP